MKDNPPTKKKQQQATVSQQSTITSSSMPVELVEADEEKIFQQHMDTLDLLRARITANLRSHNLSTDDLREAEALITLAEGLARAHRYIRPKWVSAVVGMDYFLGGLAEINEMLREKKWPVNENGHPSDRLPPRLDAILWF